MTNQNKPEPVRGFLSLCKACQRWYFDDCLTVWENQPVLKCDRFKFCPTVHYKSEVVFRSHFPK